MTTTPDIIDAEECAELLRCSVQQVEDDCRAGHLPGIKQGRGWIFVRADLLAFLAERARREAAERKARREATSSGVLAGSIASKVKQPRRRQPPALPVPT